MDIDVIFSPTTRQCKICYEWIEKNSLMVKICVNKNNVFYHEDCAILLFKDLHNYIQRYRPLEKQNLLKYEPII